MIFPIVATTENRRTAIILAVHDVEETRDGIEKLLTADGYRIDPARSEDDAVERARRQRPDLILVSLGGLPVEVLLAAARIRQRAGLGDEIPVVVFCVPTIPEGEEVAMANNIHAIRPDSFNHLRAFLARLILRN
jgi:CheY-like chemotaxis protein